jgi:GNAT superfamily N-acetyltransferase
MHMIKNQDPSIRLATQEDIPTLAYHHRKMFEEIWEKKNRASDPALLSALEEEYARKLTDELKSGTCIAWVTVLEGRIVSSGAISILSYVPVPHDLSSKIAFLHSIYTEKPYRNHHFAQGITREATRYCRQQGIRRLYLFSSDDGRSIYEKNGFMPVDNLMMLYQ